MIIGISTKVELHEYQRFGVSLVIFGTISLLLILMLFLLLDEPLEPELAAMLWLKESIGMAGMSQDDLEKLPCYTHASKSKESSVNCAVCLENLEDGDKCRLLPMCKHSFHAQCVDAWLLKTPICPICRTSKDSRGPCTDHRRRGQAFQRHKHLLGLSVTCHFDI